MNTNTSPLHATPRTRRQNLAEAVASIGRLIASGQSRAPDVEELRDLAAMCEDLELPLEAARIRRWIPTSDAHV